MDVPNTVTTSVSLSLIDDSGGAIPLTVRLGYNATRPYAITAVFLTGAESSVRWVFGRELLTAGLDHSVGDGDVRVSPGTGDGGRGVVLVELASPDGYALLEFPRGDLRGFLTETFRRVPAGSESAYLDVDDVVRRLLLPMPREVAPPEG